MTEFYLPEYFKAEYEIAAYIVRLLKIPCDKIEPVITNLKKKQPDAVVNACNNRISILCGPPGTGKTTTLKRIVDSFQKAGLTCLCLCPTGKAAKRAFEVINDMGLLDSSTPRKPRVECHTIHMGMKFNVREGRFMINEYNPFDYDVIIVDEFPMTDCLLFHSLISSVDFNRTRVVLCGDQYQLPSIQPGNIGRDLIDSRCIPTVQLDYVFRTGPDSGIVYNANRILRGQPVSNTNDKDEKFTDFYWVEKQTEEESFDFIMKSACDYLPRKRKYDSLFDIHVLAPGKRGIVGTKNFNSALKNRLNGSNRNEFRGFSVNDKVINKKNNYNLGIVNGDIGVVMEVIKEGNIDVALKINFGPGAGIDETGIVTVDSENLSSIYLSYCNTIHSSQGSEYNALLIPVHRVHWILLFRELIYTGLTRARKFACIVGDKQCLAKAIKMNNVDKRLTNLSGRIQELYSKEIK